MTSFRACSRCGKIHPTNYKCNAWKNWKTYDESQDRGTYAWKQKSLEIRSKAQYLCEVCKAEGRYTYDNLEVHHIVKIRDDKELMFDDSNLICLCHMHHSMADEGTLDAEYLKKLVEERECPQG